LARHGKAASFEKYAQHGAIMTDEHKPPYWIGFDLGGTKMLAKVYDSEFREIGQERKRTKGHGGATAGLERILKTIGKAVEDAGVSSNQLGGIGVGFPGPVDMEVGTLLEAVNLGWQDMPLRQTLERELGCPAAIANDVDVGVFAEYRFGAARGAHCVLGVFPGTGIGGGCVYGGKIFRSKFSSVMEFGHVQINPRGQLCGCGHYGCLETEASRLAIAAEAAKAAYRGEAPHLRETVGADVSEIRSAVIADSIKAGDTAVEVIVRQAAQKIGIAIGNVCSLMCPDVIVLGGGLVEAMPEIFVKEVTTAARQTVMPPLKDFFQVVPAQLGDDASVLGAAAWAAECLGGPRL
jgi:glucokinase